LISMKVASLCFLVASLYLPPFDNYSIQFLNKLAD
jgi:hypothetical protein